MKKFNEIKIGEEFKSSGTLYIKQSSRTARIVDSVRWFYFGKHEIVNNY